MNQLLPMLVAAVLMLVMVVGLLFLVARFYQRSPPGTALVVTGPRGMFVAKSGTLVYPIINTAELIDMKERTLRVERRGRDALSTSDDVRFDVDVSVAIRIHDDNESILHVAKTIGCAAANDVKELESRFLPTVVSLLGATIAKCPADELLREREEVVDKLQGLLQDELGPGFRVERVALDRVERTPMDGAGPFR